VTFCRSVGLFVAVVVTCASVLLSREEKEGEGREQRCLWTA
jgi:hypothetical protein